MKTKQKIRKHTQSLERVLKKRKDYLDGVVREGQSKELMVRLRPTD